MRNAIVAAVVAALVSAVGASAGTVLVTSKQIKNGSILTQDIHKGAVRSANLQDGGVRSADIASRAVAAGDIATGAVGATQIGSNAVTSDEIAPGQVTPSDVTMPAPTQMDEPPGDAARADVGDSYELLDSVGTYTKQDPSSALQVDWSGSAAAGFSPCVFQLRVDGQPSAANAGETYVGNGQTLSISSSSLFDGLSDGPHSIEIWARVVNGGGARYPCTVGPAGATIGQTIVVSEQVV